MIEVMFCMESSRGDVSIHSDRSCLYAINMWEMWIREQPRKQEITGEKRCKGTKSPTEFGASRAVDNDYQEKTGSQVKS